MKNGEIHFVQISDIHLFADEDRQLLGVNTQESFSKILELVSKEKKIDFILLSGDLSQDASAASYRRLASAVSKFNVPVYFVPGNHDDTRVLEKIYPLEKVVSDKQIVFPQWQLILLDSHIQEKVEGYLEPNQLVYLEKCLQAYPKHHAIISFHHQPVPVGCKWLDALGVKNSKEFWQVVQRYPQVHTVLFGHVHQQFEQSASDIKVYSAPACCFQFKRNQDEFGLEELPPGIRKVVLHPDGRLETEVKRLPAYVGRFDADAKGY